MPQTSLSVNGSSLGTALQELLMTDDIQIGSAPSYQTCKTIYLYHPLGQKMAESPVKMAQSQKREISCPDSPEDRVRKAFLEEWKKIGADKHIFNLARTARVYGIASIALLVKDKGFDTPIDYSALSSSTISFNIFDPLNTAGSLVLSQNPTDMDFMKVDGITVQGKNVHRSRTITLMNEEPVYIAYTTSAFGFVGRSVYQRALYPLKSFLQTMVTDDLVTVKAGVLVAMLQQAGSIIDNVMLKLFGTKRQIVKEAKVGNVISIGLDEKVETLNFRNMEGPYATSRGNILKNIATSADMPAKLLENETFVGGFGEGTEDAKSIAWYIDGIREWIGPAYEFFDRIVQYRAWNPEFYKTIQKDFEEYAKVSYNEAFYRWTNSFTATWPNLLKEPPSKLVEVEKVKLESITNMLKELVPALDPENKALMIQWAADNFNALKMLFTEPLVLDYEAIAEHGAEQEEQARELQKQSLEEPEPGEKKPAADDKTKPAADSEVRGIIDDLRSVRDSLMNSAVARVDSAPRHEGPPVSVRVDTVERTPGVKRVTMRRLANGDLEGSLVVEEHGVRLNKENLAGEVHGAVVER